MSDPYHSGERALQEQTGERAKAILNARGIADSIPPGAVNFLDRQQICVLGWRSPDGDVWASVLAGRQGFAQAIENRRMLVLRLDGDADTLMGLPPLAGLREGDPLGSLFIELSTRRRLRVNGRVAQVSDRELTVAVDQAYANCPKYIQRRTLEPATDDTRPRFAAIEAGGALTEDLRAGIAKADTLFVASAHPDGAVDVSHRGGARGFVRLSGAALRIPDYPGNSMFNTLGNLRLNPCAGLAFVDFATNRQLKLTGRASLDLNAGETDGETGGTGRWWLFEPAKSIVAPLNIAMRSDFVEASPFNP